MKRIRAILCVFLVLLLPLGLLTSCGGKSKDTIRLVLDWTPNTNHTGIYVAQALGYFEELGITVEITQPPEGGALPLTAAGNAEFAISFQEEMAPAIAKDVPLPVTAVAAIVSHNTSGIISLKESGILSPKDLEGKRVAAWNTPLVQNILGTVMAADGGNYDKMDFVSNNVTDAASALQSDIDAVWVFYAWDGIATQVAGLDVNYFDFIEYYPTFDYYTPVIIANNDFLAKNPDKAKAFLAAVSKGYQYTIENPKEAGDILIAAVPGINENLVHRGLEYLSTQFQSDAPRWGEIDPARWSNFYQWMFEQGLLENSLGEAGFTNEYLP